MFFSLTRLARSMIQKHTERNDRKKRISVTFDSRDMLLSLQIGFSFERISRFEPWPETTAPTYLKLVMAPTFFPFTLLSLWMPMALFVISLVFSALISILYLVQVLLRLSIRAFYSCSSLATPSMSSANCRSIIFLLMLTFPSCSSWASDMILSKNMLERVGDRKHPFLTPAVLNHSPMLSFIWTALAGFEINSSK